MDRFDHNSCSISSHCLSLPVRYLRSSQLPSFLSSPGYKERKWRIVSNCLFRQQHPITSFLSFPFFVSFRLEFLAGNDNFYPPTSLSCHYSSPRDWENLTEVWNGRLVISCLFISGPICWLDIRMGIIAVTLNCISLVEMLMCTFVFQVDPKDRLPLEWNSKHLFQRQEVCHQTHWQESSCECRPLKV